MNSFIESLNLWGARFLEFIVPMLWQSSLLIALVLVLDFALRRKVRAAVRYALWFVVLLKLLLPPTLALPTGAGWWLRSKPNAPVTRRILTVSYPEPVDEAPQPAITIPAPPPPAPQPSAAAWMLLTSSVGSLFLLSWLLARWRQIAHQIRAASPAPPQIVELFNQIQSETVRGFHGPGNADPPSSDTGAARHQASPVHTNLEGSRGERPRASGASQSGAESPHSPAMAGLTRSQEPQIRLVRTPISPAVCGLFRPVILLPESLVQKLSPAQLRAVLLHELIHLRRRDVWMNCVQTFLQIAYWWHPLLWLANARIRRLREESVDDAVMLALNENSEVYAPTLLEVAKLAFNRPLASLGLVGILESKNALRQRIERLVNFTTPGRAGLSLMSVVCIAAFTAVAVPMGEAPPRSSDPGAGLDSTNLIPYHRRVDPEVFIRNIKARADGMMHTTNDPWSDILLTILDGYNCRPPGGIELNRQTGELTTQNTSEALQTLDEVIAELNLPGGERVLNPPYGLKQVLIEAHFYQMPPQQFAQLDLNSAYRNRDRNNSPSWELTSSQINQVNQIIKNLGLQPFSSARIQTSHSIQADLFEGDKTNSIELDCLPYIHDGAVDLTVLARTTGQSAPPGGWPDFADHTNCAIFSHIGFEDGGGVVLQAQAAETAPQSNLVVLLRARIIQHTAAAADGGTARENSSPQRQRLIDKLNAIVIDKFRYTNLPLAEVVRILIEQAKLHDPAHDGINFIMNQAPAPRMISPPIQLGEVNINLDPALANVRLADALSDIVKSADQPIRYSILDFGVEFSFVSPKSSEEPDEPEISLPGAADIIHASSQEQKIYRKLNEITFDAIGLPGLSLREIVPHLNEIAKKRDPSHEGINFFINEPSATNGASSEPDEVTISLDPPLAHVRLIDVLEAMVNTADHPIKFTVRDNGVEFSIAQRNSPELITRTFIVSPDGVRNILKSKRIKYDVLDSQAVLKFLELSGVRLVPPESCSYDAQNGILTVHATQNDMYELTTDDGLVPFLGIDLNTSLQDGKLLFERGKLDEAEARFQEVLLRDPENQAALYYLNLIKQQRAKPVLPSTDANPQRRKIYSKLTSLTFDRIGFPSQSLNEVVSILAEMVKQLDPSHQGISFSVNESPGTNDAIPKLGHTRIIIDPPFKHVRLSDVLEAIVKTADQPIGYTISDHGIEFFSLRGPNILNVAPPEVNIKARFVELLPNSDWPQEFEWYPKTTTNGSFTAILTGSLFETVLKKLDQRDGADLLNEGQVTTLSGRQAQLQDVDMSTFWDNTVNTSEQVSNGTAAPGNNAGTQSAATTTSPETDPYGSTFDVIPSVSSDGSAIQMRIVATVIPRPVTNGPDARTDSLAAPHIRVWQMTNNCTIWDGQTLVMGGLQNDTNNVSGAVNTNLLVFVTATLIDPAGNRIHSTDYYDGPVQ